MLFFKTTPNLPDSDKARTEFHLQQIGECIGFDKLLLPVSDEYEIVFENGQPRTPEQLLGFVGQQLQADFSEVKINKELTVVTESGGGGG